MSREGNGRLGCVPWEGFAPEPRPRQSLDKQGGLERGSPRGWGRRGDEQRQIGSDPSLRVWWPVKRALDGRCEVGVTCPLTPMKATALLRYTCMCAHTHTCTHTHMRTHAHRDTCTDVHGCTRAHAHICTHAHVNTCIHTCARMHTCLCVHVERRNGHCLQSLERSLCSGSNQQITCLLKNAYILQLN